MDRRFELLPVTQHTKLALQITLNPMPDEWVADGPVRASLQSGRDDYVDGKSGEDSVHFGVEVDVKHGADAPDFAGKLVHGKRGERFLYVAWCAWPDDGGPAARFARLKLYLSPVTRKGWSSPGVSWAQVRRGSASVHASARGADGCPATGTAETVWNSGD